MKTVAVIAEYNPFHKGHAYHIAESRKLTGAEYCIVLMSGDFVQRGAPAIYDKYTRAEMALKNGADVVLELPVLYATSGAEFFAGGAIGLLQALHSVDYLSFGSECGDIRRLCSLADMLLSHEDGRETSVNSYLKQGCSYPRALQELLRDRAQTEEDPDALHAQDLLSSPNNILALEYCKALKSCNSTIRPLTIQRTGSDYHSTDYDAALYPSATALRKKLAEGSFQPAPDDPFQYPKEILTENDFSALLKYRLLFSDYENLSQILDCTPDMANKILNRFEACHSYTELCASLKSKDLTYARISRALLHILLQIPAPAEFKLPIGSRQLPLLYVRLLGFKKEHAKILSVLNRNSEIPLLSKPADAEKILSPSALTLFRQDILAGNLYNTVYAAKYDREPVNELRRSPVIC